MLGALVLALYDNPCGDVDYPDGRGRLVDVLSSCPAGPEGLCLQVFLSDFYFAFLLNLREDVYGGKRGVSPLVGVKRGNPYQPMHPCLSAEVAIGPFSFYVQDHPFYPCLLTGLDVYRILGITIFFHPAEVHPQEHGNPVAGLRPTGPGVDAEVGVAVVMGLVEEGLEFKLIQLSLEGTEVLF